MRLIPLRLAASLVLVEITVYAQWVGRRADCFDGRLLTTGDLRGDPGQVLGDTHLTLDDLFAADSGVTQSLNGRVTQPACLKGSASRARSSASATRATRMIPASARLARPAPPAQAGRCSSGSASGFQVRRRQPGAAAGSCILRGST
jgi:hypothetical protein